jgi:hypothetical protein
MASGLSVYSANLINNYILRGTAMTVPTSFWIALFTNGAQTLLRADNLSSASTYEISGGGYTRLQIDKVTKTFSVSSGGLTENTATWAFPEANGTWGTVKTAALLDVSAGSGGHIWYYGDLVAEKLVSAPDVFRFLTGAFDIQQ